MAGQVFLTVYSQGNALEHPVVFDKGDPASWVHEFEHQVLYLGDKQFFDRTPIRVHKPVRFLVPVDKITPQLIQLVVQGVTVEKVMLRWFQYQEKTKSDTEYFRHLFETVAFEQFRLVLPDVKDPLFARYDHALELSFRYKRAVWIYMQGNLIVSDEWQSLLCEDGEDEESEPETSEEPVEETQEVDSEENALKVKLSDAKFLPEEGKTDFNKECNVSVNVEYLSETNRKKVLFKLFSIYNNNTQDMQHETEAFESGGKADARLTLHYNDEYYSDTSKPAGAVLEYFVKVSHPEADEIESERLKLPLRKQQTVQFIEIPDVLFNHNSAVPCIDANETLVGTMVTIIVYAYNNPDKEIVIYGHTDSSGETDYNLELSELRCKSIKALLDNKPDDFANVCIGKFKVEDYQTILTSLAKTYNWDCDPGAIDNQNGPKTEAALKNFQIDYNLFFEQSIDEDGKIGKQTWGALFKVIRDIIWNIASKETGGTIPTLKYGKGGSGITACGEKFAKDAYARNGRKSKEDRRVEIVFSNPSEPIVDTPYVDTILMEPIEIIATPEQKKLTGMLMWCSHTDDGKKRIAHWGHTLEIVPDVIGNDTVTLQAQPTNGNFPVTWQVTGYKKITLAEQVAKLPVNGLKTQAGDFILSYFTGQIRKLLPPQKIAVKAIDENNGVVYGKIAVYPANVNSFEWDLKKKWSEVFEIVEKIKNGCSFLGEERKRFNASFFEGKLTFSVGWKEDPSNNLAFLAVSVKGGFQPLIGLEFRQPIPIKGIASYIPAKLLNYAANIEAYFAIGGNVALTASIERSGTDDFKGTGEVSGSLSGSLGISAVVGNGKILKVDADIGTGLSTSGQVYIVAEDDAEQFRCEAALEAKWDGVKGAISWSVIDGKWSGKHECILVSEQTLWKSRPPLVIYPR